MNTPPTKAPLSFWLTTLTMSLIPLTPPKLAIKTNFACREIKPSLAEGWHRLPSIPLCFLCSAFYYYHSSFFPTFSLANNSIQHGYVLRADPHLPLIGDEYAAVKKKNGGGSHNMDIVVHWTFICTGAWSPFQIQQSSFVEPSPRSSLSLDFHVAHRELFVKSVMREAHKPVTFYLMRRFLADTGNLTINSPAEKKEGTLIWVLCKAIPFIWCIFH